MSQGNRPGGLTALAVINFVLAGFACLGILGLVAILNMADKITDGQASLEVASEGGLMISIVLSLLTVALLIVSGTGYLGQKKKLGFLFGNIYAMISILSTLVGIMTSGFEILSVVGFIYPMVTLALLNTTFKEDFINP